MDRISVCIATYNGHKYIYDQLLSILPQLSADDEVIISDDSSTDDTLHIIGSINDPRIKIFANQTFRNPIYNFENALKQANNNVIFFSDQDDIWLPNKVEIMMKELKDHDLVLSNCYIGDSDLKIVKDSYFEWRNSKKGLIKNIWRNSYLGCCMCFDRKILVKALPFPPNIPMHDMWIGLVTEVYFKPKFIEDRLMIYRRHAGNATVLDGNFKSKESMYTRLMFRLNLLFAIVQRVIGVA